MFDEKNEKALYVNNNFDNTRLTLFALHEAIKLLVQKEIKFIVPPNCLVLNGRIIMSVFIPLHHSLLLLLSQGPALHRQAHSEFST